MIHEQKNNNNINEKVWQHFFSWQIVDTFLDLLKNKSNRTTWGSQKEMLSFQFFVPSVPTM